MIPWGEAVAGLAMRLSSTGDRHPAEREVELLVELRNVSERTLVIGAFTSEAGGDGISVAWLLQARISTATGRPLPSSGPITKSAGEPRLRPIEIASGGSVRPAPIPASSIQVELNGEWIALNSRPETYSIQFVYALEPGRLGERQWSGSVASNRLLLSFH
jgi:hypothetical protein